MADQQNYKNHTRWFPLFHFVLMPLLALNFLSHLVRLFMAAPESGRKTLAFWVLLSLVLILMALAFFFPLKYRQAKLRYMCGVKVSVCFARPDL